MPAFCMNLRAQNAVISDMVRDKQIKLLLSLAAFVVAVGVMLVHRPWSQIEAGDEAIWDYVAQCIVRGQVPYRDVVEIKAPLSAYLSATAVFISKAARIRDVIAVRVLNVIMAGLLSTVTLLVGVTYLRSRTAAILASLIPLTPSHFAEWVVAGTEPKLPMILFGMVALLLVARRKPFWAGFFSMLSCLCWQPGLMFTGVAFLIFSRYLTTWRDLAALKVILGAALPLVILILYFFRVGALADLWSWTVAFNLNVYAPQTIRSFSETLALLWKVLVRVFRLDLLLVALGFVGLIAFCFERVRERSKRGVGVGDSDLFRDGLMILPLTYLAFCFLNFQSGPDLIPLFPFVGLFAGWCLVRLGAVGFGGRFARPLPMLALIVIAALILFRGATYKIDSGATLRDQDEELAAIANILAPDDRIYVHGTVEILVLLNRPNLNPYIFLDRGKDDWIARGMPAGFEGLISEMDLAAPKVLVISRLGKVAHRAELEQWVKEHYDPLELRGYRNVFVRKQS
jgi:DolP-mannose mannosyltransferase